MKKNGEKGEQIGLFSLEDSKEKKTRKRKKKDVYKRQQQYYLPQPYQ